MFDFLASQWELWLDWIGLNWIWSDRIRSSFQWKVEPLIWIGLDRIKNFGSTGYSLHPIDRLDSMSSNVLIGCIELYVEQYWNDLISWQNKEVIKMLLICQLSCCLKEKEKAKPDEGKEGQEWTFFQAVDWQIRCPIIMLFVFSLSPYSGDNHSLATKNTSQKLQLQAAQFYTFAYAKSAKLIDFKTTYK